MLFSPPGVFARIDFQYMRKDEGETPGYEKVYQHLPPIQYCIGFCVGRPLAYTSPWTYNFLHQLQ